MDAVHICPSSLRNEIREGLRDGGHLIQPPEPEPPMNARGV